MHFNIPKYVKNLLPLSLNLTCPLTRPKKLEFSWFDFLIRFSQYWKHVTFTCKKYKFTEELVGFTNDLSITGWLCSTQVFDWYLCRIQCKKNCFFTKKLLITKLIAIVLTNINKAIVVLLWDRTLTQGTTKNIPWAFFLEYTHPLIETSSRGSCNSQEFDLGNLFYF